MADRKFIFKFSRAPGDVLMLTALVRDLQLTYGAKYQLDVETPFPHLWEHNPYLNKTPHPNTQLVLFKRTGAKRHDSADSRAVAASKRGSGLHYCTAFHRDFTRQTGIPVELLYPQADIHLTAAERADPMIPGRYWVIVPGGKTDMTNKIWYQHRFQEVVDKLTLWGVRFVQEGAHKRTHVHQALHGVVDLLGQTTIRQLIRNIYHADGVICGCSLPMHIAAALDKPCVVLFGGREEPQFEAYVNSFPGSFGPSAAEVKVPHRLLHTIGLLPCCRERGCWLRRVAPLPDRSRRYNRSLCKLPDTSDPRQTVPQCLSMISADLVVENVMWYYEQGYLPPLEGWGQTLHTAAVGATAKTHVAHQGS